MLSHIFYTLLNCEYVSRYHFMSGVVFGLELGETFPIDKQRFPAKSTNNEPLSY